MSHDALIHVPSPRNVAATCDAIRDCLDKKGIRLFACFDHAANAAEAGLPLRPATVLVFGNPAVGTQLMQVHPSLALDLPLRMLVQEDEQGKTWISYHDLPRLAALHGVDHPSPLVGRLMGVLDAIAAQATA